MGVVDKVQRYHKNGVVSLKDLRKSNFYLYKYALHNQALLSKYGVEVLNDYKPSKDLPTIILYIRYYFGYTVCLKELREHQTVYRYILRSGYSVSKFMNDNGFKLIRGDSSEEDLINELNKYVDSKGYLTHLSKRLNNCISYRASLVGLSPTEYLLKFNLKRRI